MANSAQKKKGASQASPFVYLSFFTGRRLRLEFVFGTCLLIVAVFVIVKDHVGDALRPAIASARAGAAGTAAVVAFTQSKIFPSICDIIFIRYKTLRHQTSFKFFASIIRNISLRRIDQSF